MQAEEAILRRARVSILRASFARGAGIGGGATIHVVIDRPLTADC